MYYICISTPKNLFYLVYFECILDGLLYIGDIGSNLPIYKAESLNPPLLAALFSHDTNKSSFLVYISV